MQVRDQVRILFAQADGMRLHFQDDSFDLVTCLAVVEEFSDWRGALQEMARCVTPGSLLYVTVTNGKLLIPLYRFVTRLGIGVRPSWWEYGLSSLRLAAERPGWLWSAHSHSLALYSPDAMPALSQWSWLPCTPIPPRGLGHATFRSIVWFCLATSSTTGVGTDVRYLQYGWS